MPAVWEYRIDRNCPSAEDFTDSQLEILMLLANGLSQKEMASKTRRTLNTVKSIMCGVGDNKESRSGKGIFGIVDEKGFNRNKTAAVAFAISSGLLVEIGRG